MCGNLDWIALKAKDTNRVQRYGRPWELDTNL